MTHDNHNDTTIPLPLSTSTPTSIHGNGNEFHNVELSDVPQANNGDTNGNGNGNKSNGGNGMVSKMTATMAGFDADNYRQWGQRYAVGFQGRLLWAGVKMFDAADFLGEVFADFLGITDSRYQYVVDAYERHQHELALEALEEESELQRMEERVRRQREEDGKLEAAAIHAATTAAASSSSSSDHPSASIITPTTQLSMDSDHTNVSSASTPTHDRV